MYRPIDSSSAWLRTSTMSDTEEECHIPYGKYDPSRRIALITEWVEGLNEVPLSEAKTATKYWWRCPLDPCGCHLYLALLHSRLRGSGCPYCDNKRVCPHNNLYATYPHLRSYWSSNNPYPMDTYSKYSSKVVEWSCPKCSKQWRQSIFNTNHSDPCTDCTGGSKRGRRVVTPSNNLKAKYPEIVSEWSPRNPKPPEEYFAQSVKRVWWLCSKCQHEWEALVKDRVRGSVCKACKGLGLG